MYNSSDQFARYPFSNVDFTLLILTLSLFSNLAFCIDLGLVLVFCMTFISFSFLLAFTGVIPIVECILLLYPRISLSNISIQFLVFSAVNFFHIISLRVLLNLSTTMDLCSLYVEYMIILFSFNQLFTSLL